MIEGLHETPRLLAVTAIALLAKASLVGIICLVAVETAPGGFPEFRGRCMTAVAAYAPVASLQGEARKSMIKDLTVELNGIEVTTLVVGVARIALVPRCLGVAAMETARALPIRGDRLVARQAKSCLRLA
jgi:hypothetical protein